MKTLYTRIKLWMLHLPSLIVLFKLRWRSKCKVCCDGEFYPHYGLAPHTHNIKAGKLVLGSTVISNRDTWPDNFIEGKDIGQGTYYCTNASCLNSKPPVELTDEYKEVKKLFQ